MTKQDGKPLKNRWRPIQKLTLARQILKLLDKGLTQEQVAEELGIGHSTVSRYVRANFPRWNNDLCEDIKSRRDEHLAELDLVISEAWHNYQRSCEDAVTIVTKRIVVPVASAVDGQEPTEALPTSMPAEETRTLKGQSGDARYLQIINDSIEKKNKILGINAPEKRELSGTIGMELHDISDEELQRRRADIDRRRAALGARAATPPLPE